MVFVKHNFLRSDIFFNSIFIPGFSGSRFFRVQGPGPGFRSSPFYAVNQRLIKSNKLENYVMNIWLFRSDFYFLNLFEDLPLPYL